MQKWALRLILVLAVLAGLLYMFRENLFFLALSLQLQPDASFEEIPTPRAPDYSNDDYWAALPNKSENADFTPRGEANVQGKTEVDVFYVHPTTYFSSDAWNQPPAHAQANEIVDTNILMGQASAFNACCNVYVPRYRQATLYSFMDEDGDGAKALALAYEDVTAAFEYFLENFNRGRPFILAGHSQGARHSDLLLKDRIVGSELEQRLVAAYLVGFGISEDGGPPVCEHPAQTGCQINWNSLSPQAPSTYALDTICVNPLSWRTDGARADFKANRGSMNFQTPPVIEPAVADAQCLDGRLIVTEIRSHREWIMPFGEGNYHAHDYGLFYMSIRDNAADRVRAFLASRSESAG